MKLKKVFDFRN